MDVYYINHLNEKILLDSENVILKYQELFNYSWDADTDNGKITSFTREMATYPITVTVTADSDEEFADILEQSNDFQTDLQNLLHDTFKAHQRIIFNGNGYGEDWVQEAQRRGLESLADAIADELLH